MNRRILMIVLSALVLSVCASYLVYRAVGTRTTAGSGPNTLHLVAAARDLEIGTLIHPTDLKTIAWSGPLPKGAMTKNESLLVSGGLLSPHI